MLELIKWSIFLKRADKLQWVSCPKLWVNKYIHLSFLLLVAHYESFQITVILLLAKLMVRQLTYVLDVENKVFLNELNFPEIKSYQLKYQILLRLSRHHCSYGLVWKIQITSLFFFLFVYYALQNLPIWCSIPSLRLKNLIIPSIVYTR